MLLFIILDEEDEDIEEQLDCINGLTPFLYDLAKFSPQPSGEAVRSVLQEKFEDYVRSSRNYPTFEAVRIKKDFKIYLKVLFFLKRIFFCPFEISANIFEDHNLVISFIRLPAPCHYSSLTGV